MLERTETGYEIFPECTDTLFTMTAPAEKGKTMKGKYYYIFRAKAIVDGKSRKYGEAVMTWMAADILRALRCKEVGKGVFEWDKAEINGRSIIADVVHEPDYKDPDKVVAKWKNIRQADIPSESPEPPDEPIRARAAEDEIPF